MKTYERISRKALIEARDIYESLLLRKTRESEWQKFFTAYPFVLSTTLPLKMRSDHIVPMGRPGLSEPDFVFYPWDTKPVPYYGVIELKKPESRIVTFPRANVAILSRDAETAIEQGKTYVEQLRSQLLNAERSAICLGNQAHIFIIMGLKAEISQKLGEKLFREQIEKRLPQNLQLLPYDSLFEQFEASIPPQIMILIPQVPIREGGEISDEVLKGLDEEEEHFLDGGMCG